MKNIFLSIACMLLFSCIGFAQDSTGGGMKKNHTMVHKKSMHTNNRSNGSMSADSVSNGKVTTNPNGKTGSNSGTIKKRTTRTMKATPDSTK